MPKRPRYRYILSGGVKPTDPIGDYRLVAANHIDPEYGGMDVIRVTLPDDLVLEKWACDPYATTNDRRRLEELECVRLAYSAPLDRFVALDAAIGDEVDLIHDPDFAGQRLRLKPRVGNDLARLNARMSRMRMRDDRSDDAPLFSFTFATPRHFEQDVHFLADVDKAGDLTCLVAYTWHDRQTDETLPARRHADDTLRIRLADKARHVETDPFHREVARALNRLTDGTPTDVVLDATSIIEPERLGTRLANQAHIRRVLY